jgi:hypothetical protein
MNELLVLCQHQQGKSKPESPHSLSPNLLGNKYVQTISNDTRIKVKTRGTSTPHPDDGPKKYHDQKGQIIQPNKYRRE